MDWVTPLIDILVKVLGNGTLLLGLIVAIGYALLKKPLRVVVSGFIKSAVGITLLLIGATTVVGVMLLIGDLSAQAIGVEGISVIGWFYAYILPMPVLGATIGLSFVEGFLVNLLLARFTRFKYITLNPDTQMAETVVVLPLHIMGLRFTEIVIIASIFLGLIWS